MKRCSSCRQIKDITLFGVRGDGFADGYRAYCKACGNEAKAMYVRLRSATESAKPHRTYVRRNNPLRAPQVLCVNGCGRPNAGREDQWCVECALEGKANQNDAVSAGVAVPRVPLYDITCMMCGERQTGALDERAVRYAAVYRPLCKRCGGSVSIELSDVGHIGSTQTDETVHGSWGKAWKAIPTGLGGRAA